MNKQVKTSELAGAALDWAAAKCEGKDWQLVESFLDYYDEGGMHYADDWSQGGPIIEREGISVDFDGKAWTASVNNKPACHRAKTPLIAAMRCYIANVLGDTVEIPKELSE